MSANKPEDKKKRYQEILALSKTVVSDFETPFNDMEMQFIQMAIQQLEGDLHVINDSSPYKSMISRYLPRVRPTVLESNLLNPQEDLYQKARSIFRLEREFGSDESGRSIVLIRRLALLLGGHDRITSKDQYQRICKSYNFKLEGLSLIHI